MTMDTDSDGKHVAARTVDQDSVAKSHSGSHRIKNASVELTLVVLGLAGTGYSRFWREAPGDAVYQLVVTNRVGQVNLSWSAGLDIRVQAPHCLGSDQREFAIGDHHRRIWHIAQTTILLRTRHGSHRSHHPLREYSAVERRVSRYHPHLEEHHWIDEGRRRAAVTRQIPSHRAARAVAT